MPSLNIQKAPQCMAQIYSRITNNKPQQVLNLVEGRFEVTVD
jgi:hypothetical protein